MLDRHDSLSPCSTIAGPAGTATSSRIAARSTSVSSGVLATLRTDLSVSTVSIVDSIVRAPAVPTRSRHAHDPVAWHPGATAPAGDSSAGNPQLRGSSGQHALA